MKITIGHLYPDLLNLYGDRGNIQCMMKRCQWRGIEAETLEFKLEDEVDFSKLDIVSVIKCRIIYQHVQISGSVCNAAADRLFYIRFQPGWNINIF